MVQVVEATHKREDCEGDHQCLDGKVGRFLMWGDGCFGVLVQGKAHTASFEIVNGQVRAQEAVTEDVKFVVPSLDTYDAIVNIILVVIERVVFEGHTKIVA